MSSSRSNKFTCIIMFSGLAVFLICLYSGVQKTGFAHIYSPHHATVLHKKQFQTTPPSMVEDVTIVTAYFNLGTFQKGSKDHVVGMSNYLHWMKVYGRIVNPVVAYFDDEDILRVFVELRKQFGNRTKAFLVNRQTLWTFQIIDQIRRIFEQPGYPNHLPNTIVPEYSCAMHAKFELLRKSAEANNFNTAYIGWLDIGLFRFDKGKDIFGLWLPKDFNPKNVSYARVGPFNPSSDIKEIIYSNSVWVSGAMNLATITTMKKYTNEYLKFVKYSLDKKLISTDQQVIYGMYTEGVPADVKPSVSLQLYSKGYGDPYFILGYICREAWKSRQVSNQVS